MSEFCPLCLSKGRKTVLKYFQINLSEATRMCADVKCPYPFGLAYTDTFIQRNVVDMFRDDGIKLGVESVREPVPLQPSHGMKTTRTEPVKGSNLSSTSQPSHGMKTTRTEPVKGSNLPSTSQSLVPQENEIICELMDLIESDGFCNENVEDMDFNSAAEFESLFKNLVEEIGLGKSQTILLGQDTGLSAASDSNLNTGLTIESDLKLNNGLPTDSDMRLNNGLTAASDLNLNTGLTTDSDMRLNTGLSVDSGLKLNTQLPTGSDIRLNSASSVDSDLKVNTGLLRVSDLKKLNTELSTDNKSKTLNTELSTDNKSKTLNTELSTDNKSKTLNTELSTDNKSKTLNTELSTDNKSKTLNTELSTDNKSKTLNTELSTDNKSKTLNTELSTDNKSKTLNTELSTDNKSKTLNTELSTDNKSKTLNTELSTDNKSKTLNTELSTDNKSKTLNTGSSADSFSSRAERRTVKDAEGDVQLKPLLADIEEKNDNILAETESCAKYAESSSSLKVTAGKYEVAPTSNQSQELSVTSLYDVSKHIGTTAAAQSLLNRSPVPATVTVQALHILHDSVGLETVATAAYDDPGTGDGEMIISVQSDTKGKIEISSYDIMACDSTSAEKSFGVLSAEISHSVTINDNVLTENRTDIISAEVGTPKLTPYTAMDRWEHSCTSKRDENDVAASPELLSVGETTCSLRAADKVVSEKKESDEIAAVDTLLSIVCTDHSYFKVRDENGTAVTKHSFVSENSVPVTVDIENTIQPLSVPNTGSLTVHVLSVALDDVHVRENVKVSLFDDASMSSGTETKETIVRELNLETDSSTANNMFPKMNSIADTSQQNLMTHANIEVTVTDSGQAVTSGVPIMLEKLMSEGKTHTLQTNCAPGTTAETANLKSDNTCVEQYTDTTVFDMDILERLPVTTTARHSVTSRSNYTGISCPQCPVVSSGLQQKETANRAHVQKPELCSQSRAQCVAININSTVDLDGHQYSCSTHMKNGSCLTNAQRPCGAGVKNGLVAESQNHVAPQTVRTGDSLNSCVATCSNNVPLPDLSKLEGKVVSATHVNPHVFSTCLPYQQNVNSVQPLFSDSSAAVSQKGAKHDTTAPKTQQNKRSGTYTSSRTLLSKPNDVKLCNTQQSKLNTKEMTINKIMSFLQPHTEFSGSNRDKFPGFVFEKPFVPEGNLRPCSKKKKISKTESLPKGRKTHSEQRLPVTTTARHSVTSRSNYTGISCPQTPVVSSGLQQKETANRAHVQKPELCSQSRAQCVAININSTVDLDGHQYSCSTHMKNGSCLTNAQRPCGAGVKNGLVAESQNHVAPQTVRTGDSLNSCVATCSDNVPLPDLSKLEGKVVSATRVNPHVFSTCLPYQQNLNSVQPLFSDSSAAVSQKGAKHDTTAPKTQQNKRSGTHTASRTLLSKPNDVKLCNTQQSKLNTKEMTINNIMRFLRPHTEFSGSNKDKFPGFIFEKPFVPEGNLRPCSKKKKISKTESLPKGRKTHSEQNELLVTLKNNPHPDHLNCNSSSTDSSNRVTMLASHGSVEDITVENTNVADHVYVKNKSDDGSLDWLQQLLM